MYRRWIGSFVSMCQITAFQTFCIYYLSVSCGQPINIYSPKKSLSEWQFGLKNSLFSCYDHEDGRASFFTVTIQLHIRVRDVHRLQIGLEHNIELHTQNQSLKNNKRKQINIISTTWCLQWIIIQMEDRIMSPSALPKELRILPQTWGQCRQTTTWLALVQISSRVRSFVCFCCAIPRYPNLLLLPFPLTGAFDVICARGKTAFQHPGNQRFRALIERRVEDYAAASNKFEKSVIVSQIVDEVRQASPSGGFIRSEKGLWYEVGDAAREKVGQRQVWERSSWFWCLRELCLSNYYNLFSLQLSRFASRKISIKYKG